MSWPTPQDYNEAMQAPWLNLNDRALKSGKPALDFLGLPRPMTGAFASVYKLECDGKSFAVKLFLRKILDQQLRYTELSNSINSKELIYTVGFQYQPEGISIRNQNYPILKMDWVEGDNLDFYISEHLSETGSLSVLLHHFRQLAKTLRNCGVAHGDLQHGNILVKNGEMKLVDYDGMFVSKLRGMRSNELGHPNFQHPGRNDGHFGPYLDNFSAWVIQTSLLCVSVDPSIWDKLSAGDDNLLFRRSDFERPFQSETFKFLENHEAEPIRTNVKLLKYLLAYPPDQVPALDENIMSVENLPQIRVEEIVRDRSTTGAIGTTGSIGAISSTGHAGTSSGITPKATREFWKPDMSTAMPQQSGSVDNDSLWQRPTGAAGAAGNSQESQPTFSGDNFPDWMKAAPVTQSSPPSPQETSSENARPISGAQKMADAAAKADADARTIAIEQAMRPVNNNEPWPRYEQYRQAFNEPDLNFADPELRQGRIIPEIKGLGTNGFVFHVRGLNRHIAVKCFKEHLPDRQKRFGAVKKYVTSDAHRYFIDFEYQPEGIRVGKWWYPVLKMDWIPTTLGEYINANIRNKSRLAALSERFHIMIQALQTLGIAHGDLEPDNILVHSGDLKLVDYDGMYVPELEGFPGIERGHPAFQHPGRSQQHFWPGLDYFSAWILDAELSYLKIDPMLWAQAEIRSQAAVAKTTRATHDSAFLDTHPSKNVRHTGDVLRKLLDYDFDSIPKFDPKSPLYTLRI